MTRFVSPGKGSCFYHPEMDYIASKRKTSSCRTFVQKDDLSSPEEAKDMVRHVNENRIARAIRAYRCPVCGFWHLTSKSE